MKKFYLTTTLPYVNAPPHMGHALEFVQADTIARYRRSLGDEVFFNTGTDEHGLKVFKKAQEAGRDPQSYVDEYAAKFKEILVELNIGYTNFIRTTDSHHIKAAQEFWKLCDRNGYIYKDKYEIKYCVGCELEKTEAELKNGRCPDHPHLELEIIKEENYFFKFSAFQKRLLDLYENKENFVIPEPRFREIRNFVASGLQDFSISRLKKKMSWGIPVPGDEEQVMYVWFDALVNYISALGWPENKKKFEEFWGTTSKPNAVQIAGKDNLRQQSAMWQAMLMAAGLPVSEQIFIHGFITSSGDKMSKSLGNVIDPYEVIKKYGSDSVRYFLLAEFPADEDGDFTYEKFENRYNADLANGIGNLFERVLTMAKNYNFDIRAKKSKIDSEILSFQKKTKKNYSEKMDNYQLYEAITETLAFSKKLDQYINQKEPWRLLKNRDPGLDKILATLIYGVENIIVWLKPFMPAKMEQAENYLKNLNSQKEKLNLFPRI